MLQTADGFLRFDLTAVERVPLLFGLAALANELLALLSQSRRFVGRVLQLRLVADDGLLLPVMLGVQRGDPVRRLGDRRLETGGLLRQPEQGVAVLAGARAQLPNLALGLENAARLLTAASADDMRSAKHIAGTRRNRGGREPAGLGGPIVTVGNPRVADGRTNGAGEAAVHMHDR